MKKTGATIILAALLAVLLAAGCKGGDEPDETAAERYVVMGGRLVLYSGNAANVIVPDGTASIGNNAFKGCARLDNVFVPASVTYIAGGAFHGMDIGRMTYGDTVARWEEVVAGSSGLAASLAGRSVVCTDGVWNAPADPGDKPDLPTDWQITGGVLTAYTGSSTHMTVPAGVTAIAAGAFAGTDVTAADLPASVTRIEPGAFTDGTVLTYHGTREQWERLRENGDLTGLTVFAVNDDGELVGYSGNGTHVTIPDGVTAIGEGAFAGHTEITDVTIPKTVTAIGTDAFKGCTGLTDVTVPGSVTSIGEGAFEGCTGLTDVTLLGGVTAIGTDAFKGCTGLTDVTLPASVTDIGAGAFEGCDSLAKVTYGGSREELEELVGGSGIDLSDVTVTISDEASTWDIRDGVLVGYYGTETDITIPDGVTAVGEAAFAGSGVTTVTISEGVKHIDDGAFQGCGSLTHVEIPLSLDSIGYNAFAYCDTLETITFTGTKEQWIALVNANDKGIGLGDDVTVTCSDGIVSETVYVRGADAPWYTSNAPGATASDDNPGTRTKPFATIQKAVDAIIARNDGTSEYTIYVDGTLQCDDSTYVGKNGMASFSALDKKLTLTIQALSGTATLNANKKSRVIYAAPTSGALNLTLENLVITGGNTTDNAGGIYFQSSGGNFTMKSGTISGNTAQYGGGVYVSGGTFTIDGGTISGNTATNFGGGIFVYSGMLNMTNGTVGGNNATMQGGGVYVHYSGMFTMSGAARFAEDNDVYLNAIGSNIATITVVGALTAESPVATITPSAYTADRQVLTAGTGVTITQDICDKFALSDEGWNIDGEGKLAASPDMYVSETGDDTNGKGTQAKPFATIQKAVDAIIARNDGTSEYTIYVDGTLKCDDSTYIGAYGMADFSALTKKLTLTIKALSGTATLDGGARFDENGTVVTKGIEKGIVCANHGANGSLNLTLENLVITGGNSTGDGTGGGVFVTSGVTFTMKDVTISGNTANNGFGGGVWVSGGTFTMKGGTISGNTARGGGGVCVYGGTFNMSGGEISGNTAINSGGVLVTRSGTFTMTGGRISGNTVSDNGSGVYINAESSGTGTFNISGAAKVAEDNDVYLDVYDSNIATITVAGALTAESPVATITPAAYTAGTQVLTAGTGMTITQDICDKFALTPASDGATWEIAPDATGAGGVIAQRTYTFKVESGGTEIAEGSELPQSATITLSEVRRDGVALTESDGTFLIEMTDGCYSFASFGLTETSATGLPATISLPPLPPSPIPLLVYVKAELANGIVIEDGIEVLIVP